MNSLCWNAICDGILTRDCYEAARENSYDSCPYTGSPFDHA